MTCYYPLKAWDVGKRTPENKIKYKITGFDTKFVMNNLTFEKVTEPVLIPCGHCLGCRLDYSKNWAVRCSLEASLYDFNYFITLTYDDEHLGDLSLDKKDLQDFIKGVRNYFYRKYDHSGIRFFACGEYGPKNLRKHFHLILFNLPLSDLKEEVKTGAGYSIFSSELLTGIWNKGFVTVQECCFDSCAYVARYVVKKKYGQDKDFYKKLGIIPEFVMMSNHPGIGFEYFKDNYEKIYQFDKIYFPFKENMHISIPPKYFDKLYRKLNESHLEDIKNKRLFSMDVSNSMLSLNMDYDYKTYLKVLESEFENKTKLLMNRGFRYEF